VWKFLQPVSKTRSTVSTHLLCLCRVYGRCGPRLPGLSWSSGCWSHTGAAAGPHASMLAMVYTHTSMLMIVHSHSSVLVIVHTHRSMLVKVDSHSSMLMIVHSHSSNTNKWSNKQGLKAIYKFTDCLVRLRKVYGPKRSWGPNTFLSLTNQSVNLYIARKATFYLLYYTESESKSFHPCCCHFYYNLLSNNNFICSL